MSDSDQSQPSEWTPPTVEELHAMLPQYEISGIIGRGGMGAVYRGRQARLGRDVAIKVLPESFSQGDDELNFAARFEQEARAMASLDHPAIISVFDFGETDQGQLYFVMEFIDGMDIHQYLRHHGGRLPQEQALSITAHVLDALEYAHNHGIVHRDIKPANILLNHEGRVKIADFGLAKTLTAAGEDGDSAPALTMTNVAVGTPDYVAPEALDSDRTPDHRADLYAVGVMLYQMLTGSLPRGQVKMPSELIAELDPRIDGIVSKSLQADPDDRYSSASEIRSALDPIFTTPITKAEGGKEKEKEKDLPVAKVAGGLPRPKKAEPPKAPLYVGIGLAAVLVIGGLIAFFMRPSGDEGEKMAAAQKAETTPNPSDAEAEAEVGRGVPAEPSKGPESSAIPIPSPNPEGPGNNAEPPQGSPVKTASTPPEGSETGDPEKGKPSGDTTARSGSLAPPAAASQAKAPPATQPEPPSRAASGPPANPSKTPAPTTPSTADKKPKPVEEPTAKIPELVALQKRFEELGAERIGALDANYLKAIELEIGKAADAGDLASVTALRGEKKRVAEKQPLPESDPSGTPKGLAELRTIYRAAMAKEQSTLLDQYQTALQQLETRMTKARKFDEALVVSAFRKSLGKQSGADLQSAGSPGKGQSATLTHTEPATGTNTAKSFASASKDKPFVNSLGMKFVPVPITGGPGDGNTVLFSVWETRVKDYKEFVKDGENRPWPKPDFEQADDHPAVQVTWEDAVAFCAWLTERERKKGTIGTEQRYRLPTDHEWSCAVGIGKEEDFELLPSAKSQKLADVFPWGREWPPPKGAGNYYGEETGKNPVAGLSPMAGYEDPFDRTAPAGSFEPNEYGLHDLGGNAEEWCDDWLSGEQEKRVLRGGSWRVGNRANLLSSIRLNASPPTRYDRFGFRCVLEEELPADLPAPEATRVRPFENSLRMRFVPVPIRGGPSDRETVLFSIWETRVEDYEEFLKDDRDRPWTREEFLEDDHPVVGVSWEDAVAFCAWLTEEDRKKGKIGKDVRYRLPTDHEWSCAVGIGKEEDADLTPQAKDSKLSGIYPWGKKWPPPERAGNYYGEETKRNPVADGKDPIEGYDDGFSRTASVGSFEANEYGLYDMGGNAWEWCEDWHSTAQEKRVLRGASWYNLYEEFHLRSSRRYYNAPSYRPLNYGFRCVLVAGGGG